MRDQTQDSRIKELEDQVERLDSIIASLPGHIYWLDRHNILQGCNNLQAETAKLPSRQAIVGKKNRDMVHTQDADELDQINNDVMKTGTPYVGEEIGFRADGEAVYLTQKAPLRNKQGEIIGLLGVSFDITDRKHMEQELKAARAEAELASQTKTEFIRNLEHDIRTPLAGILSVTRYLDAIEHDEKKKELLLDVEVATNELMSYLDNIMEFSQINSGATPLIYKEFNLEHVVRGIINIESAAAKSKGLQLCCEYSSKAPKMVIGDRFRCHRLLLNLVNNAIKFTEKGYVKISVNCDRKLNDGKVWLELIVEDSGIGIAKKNHEVIFDKFTRCDPSNKGIYKGTGLGLWIVKQFIEDLKGEIRLQSELGKGSAFICRLPFQVEEEKGAVC